MQNTELIADVKLGVYYTLYIMQDTNLEERADYPVVHVSWGDARAYCMWVGKRLPSEAQFERACQGGREGSLYPWGDGETDGGVHQTNIWQV